MICHSVWTKGFAPEMKTHVPVSCRDLSYIAEVDDLPPWSLDELIANIKTAASNAARKMGRSSDYYTIAGCIAGGEAGVDMADLLSEKLGVLSNGAKGDFANRRDKKVQVSFILCNELYCWICESLLRVFHGTDFICMHALYYLQQELVRKAGMRAVRQACGETFEEVEAFLKSETFPVVSDEMAFGHIWDY